MFQPSRILQICLFFSIVVCFAADSTRTPMAVFGIKTIGINHDVATLIAERIESRLVQFNTFAIISRSDMALILKESAFQQSGLCSDVECAIQAGTILGAEQIVTGSLSKLGNTYSIVLKSITVKNGTISISADRTYTGSIELLFATVDDMIDEMFGTKVTPTIVPLSAAQPETLTASPPSIHSTLTKEKPCCTVHHAAAVQPAPADTRRMTTKTSSGKDSLLFGYGALALLAAICAVVLINQTVSP